ncbi:MAG TPA: PQQ-binding-like beta-propeller repeat protein, partial [Armatimonadota bacterium]|nr:PQQ-binding-like beta-propeller repeat protein [Armatimonadota bacterium]
CAVGVFPSEGVYVCALDAETGERAGDGRYCDRYTDMSLQGYILASAQHLFIPGGRAGPWLFDRATGKRQAQLGGGGGTYALVTAGDSIIYGPGRNTPVLEEFGSEARDRLAVFPGAKHIVVTPARSYISTKTELFALDRERWMTLGRELAQASEALEALEKDTSEHKALTEKIAGLGEEREACAKWRIEATYPDALILVGDHVIAGGTNSVVAVNSSDGAQVWQADVDGTVKGLAAARGRLLVSTDARRLYCFD